MKTAKFDYTDYSLLDSIYSETGRKPKYREVLEKLRQLVSSDYSPSHKSVYAYIDAWCLERFGDSRLKKQNITSNSHSNTISTQCSDIRQRLESFISEVEELESKANMVLSSSSEVQFLKSQISILEIQNQQLLAENENLKGRIVGFEQAINQLIILFQQRDLDVTSRISFLEGRLENLLGKIERP